MITPCHFLGYGKMDKCLQDGAQSCGE